MRVSVEFTYFDTEERSPYSEKVKTIRYTKILGSVVSMHHARGKHRVFLDLDATYDEVALESLTPEANTEPLKLEATASKTQIEDLCKVQTKEE